MLNAIQAGILTSSTKERLEQLEETKRELEARIAEEKLAKPKVTEEFIRFWLLRFRKLDTSLKDQRQALVDTFIRIRLISSMENVAPLSAGRESIFSIRLPTSLQSVPMARLLLHHTSQCILHSRRSVIIPGNLLKQQLPCRPKIPAWQLFFILYVF